MLREATKDSCDNVDATNIVEFDNSRRRYLMNRAGGYATGRDESNDIMSCDIKASSAGDVSDNDQYIEDEALNLRQMA
jgi:hypothetical protein